MAWGAGQRQARWKLHCLWLKRGLQGADCLQGRVAALAQLVGCSLQLPVSLCSPSSSDPSLRACSGIHHCAVWTSHVMGIHHMSWAYITCHGHTSHVMGIHHCSLDLTPVELYIRADFCQPGRGTIIPSRIGRSSHLLSERPRRLLEGWLVPWAQVVSCSGLH